MSIYVDKVTHGALDYAELERLGIHPDDVLDFSVNSNPYGPSPLVWDAIRATTLERYPDRECVALRHALTQRLDVPMSQLMIGNGTAELILLASMAFLQRGDPAMVVEPTFGEYDRCARLAGANPQHWRATPETGFAIHPDEIRKKLNERNYRVVFLCNPNNPTGQILPLGALKGWSEKFPNTLFVVDEAYLAFAPEMDTAISLHYKNILVLRSMTKDYALAGLRLGYVVGCEPAIDALTNIRPAWNVNALAQAAGLAALRDENHLSDTLAKLRQEKEVLVAGLEGLGFTPFPSQTHYFLLPVENGAQFRFKLLQAGILVRDCASFGLPSCVRIATRKAEENTRLLRAIREV